MENLGGGEAFLHKSEILKHVPFIYIYSQRKWELQVLTSRREGSSSIYPTNEFNILHKLNQKQIQACSPSDNTQQY